MEQPYGGQGAGRRCLVVDTAQQVSDVVVVAELFGWQVLSVTTMHDLGVEVVLERHDGQWRGEWG